MLTKIICVFHLINLFSSLSETIFISGRNETNLLASTASKLSELEHLKESLSQLYRAELDNLKKDIQLLREDIQYLKAEQEKKEGQLERLETIENGLLNKSNTTASDAESRGGEWTTILRRMDGSVDFQQDWNAYKKGFGDSDGEFFLGLDKIHALTSKRNQELLVVLKDKNGIEAFENYENFAIGNEDQQYVLHTLGRAHGTAGDAFRVHRGMKFSTYDRSAIGKGNCALHYTGGWWYEQCGFCKLTGTYNNNINGMGVIWHTFRDGTKSLKKAVMMIRPKK